MLTRFVQPVAFLVTIAVLIVIARASENTPEEANHAQLADRIDSMAKMYS